MNIHICEAKRTPNTSNIKRSSLRQIRNKFSKVKERILKTAREKQLTMYRFLNRILQSWREWDDIFKVVKKKIGNQKYNTWQTFGYEGEMKTFPKQKLRSLSLLNLPYKKC
jgi:preprotein translocase subunit SecA